MPSGTAKVRSSLLRFLRVRLPTSGIFSHSESVTTAIPRVNMRIVAVTFGALRDASPVPPPRAPRDGCANANPWFGRLARRLFQLPHHQLRMWYRQRGCTRCWGPEIV